MDSINNLIIINLQSAFIKLHNEIYFSIQWKKIKWKIPDKIKALPKLHGNLFFILNTIYENYMSVGTVNIESYSLSLPIALFDRLNFFIHTVFNDDQQWTVRKWNLLRFGFLNANTPLCSNKPLPVTENHFLYYYNKYYIKLCIHKWFIFITYYKMWTIAFGA